MNEFTYFCSPVYKGSAPEFLDVIRQVSEENIANHRLQGVNDVYPVVMSDNFVADIRVQDFCNHVAQAAWNSLDSQGYAMNQLTTHVGELWMQEHHRGSSMEEHIHKGYQIVGFYFIDTPENGSRLIVHDPRPGKVIMGLPEKDVSAATHASDVINFSCEPGDLILTNAWLPHSFTRNGSDTPSRFIHFNIFVREACACPAEVV